MKISVDGWSIAGLTLALITAALLFGNEAVGIPSQLADSLGLSAFLATLATFWGNGAFSADLSASNKSTPRIIFWGLLVFATLNILRRLG